MLCLIYGVRHMVECVNGAMCLDGVMDACCNDVVHLVQWLHGVMFVWWDGVMVQMHVQCMRSVMGMCFDLWILLVLMLNLCHRNNVNL